MNRWGSIKIIPVEITEDISVGLLKNLSSTDFENKDAFYRTTYFSIVKKI